MDFSQKNKSFEEVSLVGQLFSILREIEGLITSIFAKIQENFKWRKMVNNLINFFKTIINSMILWKLYNN